MQRLGWMILAVATVVILTTSLLSGSKLVSAPGSPGIELVMIQAGTFLMGSPEDEQGREGKDEGPQHKVDITHPFYLGKHEVTRGQFRRFVETAGYQSEAEKNGKGGFGMTADGNWVQKKEWTWKDCGFPQTDEHPVVNVSWNDAQAFVKWLSRVENREYRLPTEAEWEYAARGGTTTRYFTGTSEKSLQGYANVADASAKKQFLTWTVFPFDDGYAYTSPAGKYRPNPWGLFDMTGNVWEWCQDSYQVDYYARSPQRNPVNEAESVTRVTRGASWTGNAPGSRVASRLKVSPSVSSNVRGFRVAAMVR